MARWGGEGEGARGSKGDQGKCTARLLAAPSLISPTNTPHWRCLTPTKPVLFLTMSAPGFSMPPCWMGGVALHAFCLGAFLLSARRELATFGAAFLTPCACDVWVRCQVCKRARGGHDVLTRDSAGCPSAKYVLAP